MQILYEISWPLSCCPIGTTYLSQLVTPRWKTWTRSKGADHLLLQLCYVYFAWTHQKGFPSRSAWNNKKVRSGGQPWLPGPQVHLYQMAAVYWCKAYSHTAPDRASYHTSSWGQATIAINNRRARQKTPLLMGDRTVVIQGKQHLFLSVDAFIF